ncbi:MAG: DUF523 domain-containing protein [Sandaracinus sp.]|nr:DUF523 domain-containing protein [Myxococcales bacterium]MCB9634787.1 DUF523 domain-containing protein [Sandaracinus sp.]
MLLPHHPERVDALREPSVDDPWRVLVSGCLARWRCGVDATDNGLGDALDAFVRAGGERVRLVPFCPEDHRLGTPRTTPDLHDGDGVDVLRGRARVRDEKGADLTAPMVEGAHAMVELATREQVDFAILTDASGACGSQVVSLGCRFDSPRRHQRGVGVATAALLEAGVDVVSQRDFRTLGRLIARLDPEHVVPSDARDHHEHPWVLENLPGTHPRA